MLNIVALQGRLTADPELRQTQSGISTTRFTLAVDRSYVKEGEERKADFISCMAWRQTADFICKYFHKGSAMVLDGSIQTGSYDDKKTGEKRYTVDVIANNVSFGESKANAVNSVNSVNSTKKPSYTPAKSVVDMDGDKFEQIEDTGDLPF